MKKVGSPDIQSLADLSNAFAVVRHMRLVPFGLRHALYLAVAAVAPMLPLVLVAYPIDELIVQVATLLLGL